jgi:hypothetical protein
MFIASRTIGTTRECRTTLEPIFAGTRAAHFDDAFLAVTTARRSAGRAALAGKFEVARARVHVVEFDAVLALQAPGVVLTLAFR